ncbi:MAG: 4Fe-4S double cluster binding domain-containing protein [Candidatus Hermodarchaeota archaeon]
MSKEKDLGIQHILSSKNIPIFGIASIGTYKQPQADEFSPLFLLPNSKSLLCYGIPIPRGIIHAGFNNTLLYWRFCSMTYRRLDTVANLLCVHLEEEGFISTPIYSCYPWKVKNRKFWGLVPLVYWAEQAGVGKLTKCGLLGHKKYGTRLLMGGVITTREFSPTKNIQQDICPSECDECINACPAKAIDSSGKVDHNLCIRYANSNPLMTQLLKNNEIREQFDFETIMNTVGVEDHSEYRCFTCLKVCPLNKVGFKLTNS